jgi:hypothetical protein
MGPNDDCVIWAMGHRNGPPISLSPLSSPSPPLITPSPPRCSPFLPREQLLAVVVRGAAVVMGVGVVGRHSPPSPFPLVPLPVIAPPTNHPTSSCS